MNILPSPIPHARLPHHPDFCLTGYLPNDAVQMADLLNLPEVSEGMNPSADDPPATAEMTQGYIDAAGADTSAFPYPVLRRVADLSLPIPPLLGVVFIRRDPFLHSLGPHAEELLPIEQKKTDREALHAMLVYTHPSVAGKGITTDAVNLALNGWWAPRQSHPGQLHSYYNPGNRASARLHEKCGFRVVARSNEWVGKKENDPPWICALWQGGGEAGYVGSMYDGRLERLDG